LSEVERDETANAIAVGALRYFMLRSRGIPSSRFDFKDALSFEGETGPYLQYAVVRTRSIFRKAGTTPDEALAALAGVDPAPYLSGEGSEGIWEVWLRAAKTTLLLDQCIATAEPAYLAKHAFQLAQDFSNFYRLHHILSEEDPARKKLLLATAAVTQRELMRSLAGWASRARKQCKTAPRCSHSGIRSSLALAATKPHRARCWSLEARS
jgi:arginyl-tRNA synthetase